MKKYTWKLIDLGELTTIAKSLSDARQQIIEASKDYEEDEFFIKCAVWTNPDEIVEVKNPLTSITLKR